MRTQTGTPIYLKDYQAPAYTIRDVYLDIRLDPEATVVIATLQVEVQPGTSADTPLDLDGDEVTLDFVAINGQDLKPTQYQATADRLSISRVPQKPFELQITTRVNPTTNTQLMGLYLSSGIYCTQCEAQGFRRITYFLDRPDVLARYTTRIEAQKHHAPILLSNGNLTEKGKIEGTDRHYAVWHDPHPKPSYLFALVAGRLEAISDRFKTRSGRDVALKIYVEPGKTAQCDWALESLKRCMKWEEDVFNLEYDLDIFMIVAVSDFNMGAMENKGLNIFNDKYILADPVSATDEDYLRIEAIIAHEYFHNWTGNRITCRDWFQLCLKEGLTVFRDQEFTADMHSRPVKRIEDVKMLRARQFPEDAGPLAHPVRPSAYREINNFYTATVYEKGAELVRMMQTILGADAFQNGLAVYFKRHDGDAATVEDFIQSLEEGAGANLGHFKLWYEQAGTPRVVAKADYDEKEGVYSLTLTQVTPATAEQPVKEPLHIPIAFGLVGRSGNDLDYKISSDSRVADNVLHLTTTQTVVHFRGLTERPVPSLLRNFSAPVNLSLATEESDLLHLMAHDNDPFNRWQAMQNVATHLVMDDLKAGTRNAEILERFCEGIALTLTDDTLDPAYRSQFLSFASEADISQTIGESIDPSAIHRACVGLRRSVAQQAEITLIKVFELNQIRDAYEPSGEQVARRSLKNMALSALALGSDQGAEFARAQYEEATNLTDRLVALRALAHHHPGKAEAVLRDFDKRYRMNPLVIDKWFAVQATAPLEGTLEQVKKLMKHPVFSITNPNRIRSLVGAFATSNPSQFNRHDGAGYQFLSRIVADLDETNPQVAARLLTAFSSWRMLEEKRREKAENALKRMATGRKLSKDVSDILSRTLESV